MNSHIERTNPIPHHAATVPEEHLSIFGQACRRFTDGIDHFLESRQANKHLSSFYKSLHIQCNALHFSTRVGSSLHEGISAFQDLSNTEFVSSLVRNIFTTQIGMGIASFLIPGKSIPATALRLVLGVFTCKFSDDLLTSAQQGRFVFGDYGFEALASEGAENLAQEVLERNLLPHPSSFGRHLLIRFLTPATTMLAAQGRHLLFNEINQRSGRNIFARTARESSSENLSIRKYVTCFAHSTGFWAGTTLGRRAHSSSLGQGLHTYLRSASRNNTVKLLGTVAATAALQRLMPHQDASLFSAVAGATLLTDFKIIHSTLLNQINVIPPSLSFLNQSPEEVIANKPIRLNAAAEAAAEAAMRDTINYFIQRLNAQNNTRKESTADLRATRDEVEAMGEVWIEPHQLDDSSNKSGFRRFRYSEMCFKDKSRKIVGVVAREVTSSAGSYVAVTRNNPQHRALYESVGFEFRADGTVFIPGINHINQKLSETGRAFRYKVYPSKVSRFEILEGLSKTPAEVPLGMSGYADGGESYFTHDLWIHLPLYADLTAYDWNAYASASRRFLDLVASYSPMARAILENPDFNESPADAIPFIFDFNYRFYTAPNKISLFQIVNAVTSIKDRTDESRIRQYLLNKFGDREGNELFTTLFEGWNLRRNALFPEFNEPDKNFEFLQSLLNQFNL